MDRGIYIVVFLLQADSNHASGIRFIPICRERSNFHVLLLHKWNSAGSQLGKSVA